MVLFASVVYVIIAMAAAYVVTWSAHWAAPVVAGLNIRRVRVETASIAVLFPPLGILSLERSAWAVVLTVLALLGTATLMMWLQQSAAELARIDRLAAAGPPQLATHKEPLFQIAQPPPLVRQLAPLISAAALLQVSVLAYVLQERLIAVTCLGLATLLISWRVSALGAARHRGSARTGRWKLLFSTSFALVLTLAGLLRWFSLAHSLRDHALLNALVSIVFHEGGDKVQRAFRAAPPVPEPQGFGSGGIFSGVILWDREPKAIMLAPPLPQLFPESFSRKAVGIPFSGYYSFFKPPLLQAPPGSTRLHGDPVKVGLRSSDSYPLLMEAHQDFGNLVDLDCCSRIQLIVTNADPHPETLWFEMLVSETDLPTAPALSLGEEPLENPASHSGVVEETVSFKVPAVAMAQRFNQITVRYHLSGAHEGNSARVSVEKFVFVPRAK